MKDAFDAGKRFHVIVIDSRPKNEGILYNRYHRPAATRDRRQFPRWDMLLIILLLWLLFVLSYHLNFPGIHCLKQLLKHGVRCSYAQITSLAYLIKEACFYSYCKCRYFFFFIPLTKLFLLGNSLNCMEMKFFVSEQDLALNRMKKKFLRYLLLH